MVGGETGGGPTTRITGRMNVLQGSETTGVCSSSLASAEAGGANGDGDGKTGIGPRVTRSAFIAAARISDQRDRANGVAPRAPAQAPGI